MDLEVYLIVGAAGLCLMAGGFFVVTIFSLQDLLKTREKQEDELRANQEWLTAVLDNSNQIISVKRPDGRYVMVNRRFATTFDVEELLMPGTTDADIFPPDVADLLRDNDQQVIEGNKSIEFDQVIQCGRRRSEKHFIAHKTPLHDVLGVVTGICSVYTDVTERELARRERDRLFDLSLDCMAVGTLDGWFVLVNPRLQRLTGFSKEELTSQYGVEFMHPDDRATAVEALTGLRRGEPLVNFACRFLCKDGSYKTFEWHSMPAVEEGMVYSVAREIDDDAAGGRCNGDERALGTDALAAKSSERR